ncbi:MAG: cytochrome c [Saprospiraceae bacterium]|nr:cytochrome c [Saprospiraceae bacterium]
MRIQAVLPAVILAICMGLLTRCDQTTYKQGELLYVKFCSNCHAEDGKGLKALIPPLAGADYLKQHQDELACIIKYGISSKIKVNGVEFEQPMPGVPQLSDFEITNIINYINQAWGNDYGYVKIAYVRKSLKVCDK